MPNYPPRHLTHYIRLAFEQLEMQAEALNFLLQLTHRLDYSEILG